MHKLVKSKLLPLALAGALLLAGLGAAAIPGAVTGDAPAVVKQAILVEKAASALWTTTTPPSAPDPANGTVSADKTNFLLPTTVATGDTYRSFLTLSNSSKVAAAALLTVDVPAGLTLVSADKVTNSAVTGVSRVMASTFLVQIDLTATAPTTANLTIDIRAEDTTAPGFYTIGVTLKQVEG